MVAFFFSQFGNRLFEVWDNTKNKHEIIAEFRLVPAYAAFKKKHPSILFSPEL